MTDHSMSIAIIGMSGRFPGAADVERLWQNLRQGVEAVRPLSDQEILAAGVDPAILADPKYVKMGSVLADVDKFDASLFGMSPREAETVNPQHRLFLECAWEALEDAGYPPQEGDKKIGVYAGSAINDYQLEALFPNPAFISGAHYLQSLTANDKDYLCTRVSYNLGFTGPSIGVQTACSSSLVAISQACLGLLHFQCDLALGGGVALRLPQGAGYLHREGSYFSPDGHCRPFDSRAAGVVFGNGAGVLVLKRMEEALQEGDPIYAVIRGTAVNNDGRAKVGYSAPSIDGQAECIAMAQAMAGIEADSIGYLEAHGTGTPLGDPIEVAALTRAFRRTTQRRAFCALGSIKSNLGHLDAAAGVVGVIKTVLALQHEELPPSLHFEQPNPEIDFSSSPFFVNNQRRSWKRGEVPRRAGVSSFGIGGTNAHVILEEAPIASPPLPDEVVEAHLLPISAASDEALRGLVHRYRTQRDKGFSLPVRDLCFTAAQGRQHHSRRLALVGESWHELAAGLDSWLEAAPEGSEEMLPPGSDGPLEAPRIAFIFPGLGCQYPGMGADLYRQEPVFRSSFDRCQALLLPHLHKPLSEVLWGSSGEADLLAEILYSQVAVFVLEYSLAELWKSWGIVPDAVLGHSLGEFAAACVAGVLSLEQAITLVAGRAALMAAKVPPGAMAVVFAGEEKAREALLLSAESDVSIAAINGAENIVLSGLEESVEEAMALLAARGIDSRRVKSSRAGHCQLMEPMLDGFEALVADLSLSMPQLPLVSNLTGRVAGEEICTASYWRQQSRQTVRFAEGIDTLLASGYRLFVEVSPKPTLPPPRLTPEIAADFRWLPSLRPDDPARASLLESLGALYVRGAEVRWAGLFEGRNPHRVHLPTYPFQRRRFWAKSGHRPVAPRVTAGPPLLGERVVLPGSQQTHWKLLLSESAPLPVAEHLVAGRSWLPATAYLEMALEAGQEIFGAPAAVEKLRVEEPLQLAVGEERWLHLVLGSSPKRKVRIYSRSCEASENSAWILHARCRLVKAENAPLEISPPKVTPVGESLDALRSRLTAGPEVGVFYLGLEKRRIAYGPSFRLVQQLHLGTGEVLAEVKLPEGRPRWIFPPALLDACLHSLAAVLPEGDPVSVPIGIDRLTFENNLPDSLEPATVLSYGRLRRPATEEPETQVADFQIFGEDGSRIARVEGLRLRRLQSSNLSPSTLEGVPASLFVESWKPLPEQQLRPSSTSGSRRRSGWLILEGDAQGAAALVAEAQLQELPHLRVPLRLDSPLSAMALEDALSELRRESAELDASEPQILYTAPREEPQQEDGWLPSLGAQLAYLAQLAHTIPGARVIVVTRGAVPQLPHDGAKGEVCCDASCPGQKAVWGLVKTALLENSSLGWRLVDLEPLSSVGVNGSGGAAGQLLEVSSRQPLEQGASRLGNVKGLSAMADLLATDAGLLATDAEPLLAHRGGEWYRPILEEIQGAPRESGSLALGGRTCVVTGGLGGLGLAVAERLAQRGARHLVLVTRGHASQSAQEKVQELRDRGVDVTVRRVDVSSFSELSELFGEIESSLPPIGGIVHAAGVLDDGILPLLDAQRLTRVFAPKALGAWNLHRLVEGRNLDFFVLFSSTSALFGSAGQGSHSAASAFLDGLAQYRHSLGLVATSIQWPGWEQVGRAASFDSAQEQKQLLDRVPAERALELFEEILKLPRVPQVAVLPIDASSCSGQSWTHVLAILQARRSQQVGQTETTASSLPTLARLLELRDGDPGERRSHLFSYLEQAVGEQLRLDVSYRLGADEALNQLGMDSLMTMELKNRVLRDLGVDVPLSEMIRDSRLSALVQRIEEAMKVSEKEETGSAPEAVHENLEVLRL